MTLIDSGTVPTPEIFGLHELPALGNRHLLCTVRRVHIFLRAAR